MLVDLHHFLQTVLIAVGALLPIVDPLGSAPIYMELTKGIGPASRSPLARQVALDCFVLLAACAVIGVYAHYRGSWIDRRCAGARSASRGDVSEVTRNGTRRRFRHRHRRDSRLCLLQLCRPNSAKTRNNGDPGSDPAFCVYPAMYRRPHRMGRYPCAADKRLSENFLSRDRVADLRI